MKMLVTRISLTSLIVCTLLLSSCAMSRDVPLEDWGNGAYLTNAPVYISGTKSFSLYPSGAAAGRGLIPRGTTVKVSSIEWHANASVYYFLVVLDFKFDRNNWKRLGGVLYSDSTSDSNPDEELQRILKK